MFSFLYCFFPHSIVINYRSSKMHDCIYNVRHCISDKLSYVRWTNEFMSFSHACKRRRPPTYRKHSKIRWKQRINCIWWHRPIISKKCCNRRHSSTIRMPKISTIPTAITEWFCNLLITHNRTQRLPPQTSKFISFNAGVFLSDQRNREDKHSCATKSTGKTWLWKTVWSTQISNLDKIKFLVGIFSILQPACADSRFWMKLKQKNVFKLHRYAVRKQAHTGAKPW